MHSSTTHSYINKHLVLALPCSNKGAKTHTAELISTGHSQHDDSSIGIRSLNKQILFSHSASHKVPLTPTAIDSSTCIAKSSTPMIENEDSSSSAASRAVIASKRAAQNRAAQRAFRQRREQYVKDLERRVKEMATWSEEIEHLRFENNHLKEHVSILLRRISELTSHQMTPPLSSASSAGSCDAVVTHSFHHAYPNYHTEEHITQGPFLQPYAAHHYQHYHPPSSHHHHYALNEPQLEHFYNHGTNVTIRNSTQQPSSYQQQQQDNTWSMSDFDLDYPFDPFSDNERCATHIAPGEHQDKYSTQDMYTMNRQQWQDCKSI